MIKGGQTIMKKEKVTIQDIADALNISRNTASKAINGNATIPIETRNKVIQKAAELKYKQFAYVESDYLMPKSTGNVALLTSSLPNNSHFGSFLISGFEKRMSMEGYTISIHIVREADIQSLTLPNNFEASKVDGIICIELFDSDYSKKITSLGLPTIFIDCAVDLPSSSLQADLLLMENEHSVYEMTKTLIQQGHQRIGFVGDYNHCKSFNERWIGFNRALVEAEIALDRSCCILGKDREFFEEKDWIDRHFKAMTHQPSAFVCTNDFVAVHLIQVLKANQIKIPEDISVCAFDDASESRIVDPPLTTVHIFSNDMGINAAETLLARIKSPNRPYQISHVQTHPIFRESSAVLHQSSLPSPS